ncbi:hypothetical protein ACFVWN_20540 [Nocardiopsis flavescens]|uniref:hypothetical protein n=1 Tax=Nocardiopsis flavescens TaxID=758803 RepID=UPI00364B4290
MIDAPVFWTLLAYGVFVLFLLLVLVGVGYAIRAGEDRWRRARDGRLIQGLRGELTRVHEENARLRSAPVTSGRHSRSEATHG